MTTHTTTSPPRITHTDGDTGRCQHCQQTRPLFHHPGELQFWGFNPGDDAWLCARDWSAREQAIDNDEDIRIERNLVVWPEDEPRVRAYLAPAPASGSVGSRAQDGGGAA